MYVCGKWWSCKSHKEQTNFDFLHTEKQANYKLKNMQNVNVYYNRMLDTEKKRNITNCNEGEGKRTYISIVSD